MFNQNPPSFVLGVIRSGQPISLVNAFESPVESSGQGYVEKSVGALKDQYKQLDEIYDLRVKKQVSIPDSDIQEFISTMTADV
jgi:hypothetical protein